MDKDIMECRAVDYNKKEKHNGIIGFWKFLFALMICILHGNVFATNNENVLFNGGAIAVEFFFVVSGYLLAKSILKNNKEKTIREETWNFIFKKIKHIFPYVLIAFVLIVAIDLITKQRSITSLVRSIWDLFLLRMSGISTNRINAVAWYISAMLISMLIIYPIGRKFKKTYTCLIAPIIVILLGGFMSHEFENLRTPMRWVGLCYKGLLRSFLELNVGIVCYEVTEKFKSYNYTKFARVLLTITEILCFSSIFLIANFIERGTRLDYIMLLIMSIGIIIAFSEKTLFYKISCNKFVYYLEKLSLPIYLNQMFFVYLIQRVGYFNRYNYYEKIFIFLFMNIILSCLCLKIVDLYNKNKGTIYGFLKKMLIKEEKTI